MKLIIGLGNPGKKYAGTRHNIGFEVLDELATRLSADPKTQKFDAKLVDVRVHDRRCLLLWPQTFMNRSGQSVAEAVRFFKVEFSEVLIVCDDFHLPCERIRFRPRGSAGGQKGLADILRQLGTEEIGRLRLGVGPLPPRWEAADFVLSRFSKKEREEMEPVIVRATTAVVRWIETGIDVCMNEFNAAGP